MPSAFIPSGLEGAPVEVQVVGEALAVEGDRKVSAPVLADCAAR